MEKEIIAKIKSRLDKTIPNQDYKYVSDYGMGNYFYHVIFESTANPGEKVVTSVKITEAGFDETSFKLTDI